MPDPLTDDRIEQIRLVARIAPGGPWHPHVVPALLDEIDRLRDSIRWRCSTCGCAFPDHPDNRLPEPLRTTTRESTPRCSQCVGAEVLRGEVQRLRAELAVVTGAARAALESPVSGGSSA